MSTTPQIHMTEAQLIAWRQQVRVALNKQYFWDTLELVAKGMGNEEAGKELSVSAEAIKIRLRRAVPLVRPLIPMIGVLEPDRTGLSTLYRYASDHGLCPPSAEWVIRVHQAFEGKPRCPKPAYGRKAVLAELPLGLTNPQIGERINLTRLTVKTHLNNLVQTLESFADEADVRLNRTGMAGIALMMGHTSTAKLV